MSSVDSRPPDSWVIGSAPGCDLRVSELTVSARHCRLSRTGAGFTIEDLGSTNGTYVNGNRLKPGEPVRIAHKARVFLGGRVEMPWPVPGIPTPDGSPPRALTTLSPGPGRGAPLAPGLGFSPRSGPITIGRSPESSVKIDLPIVSWNHAVITEENGQYSLKTAIRGMEQPSES